MDLLPFGTQLYSAPRSSSPESQPTTKEPRAFECPNCHLRFTRLHTLKNHLSVHDNGAVFKCSTCDKRFGRLNDKRRHERAQHAEKKFVCRGQSSSGGTWGCGKAFARKDALGEHLRSKTGQRCRERVVHDEEVQPSSAVTIDLTGDDSDSTVQESTEAGDAPDFALAADWLQQLSYAASHHAHSSTSKYSTDTNHLNQSHWVTTPFPSPNPSSMAAMTRPYYTIFNDFLIEDLNSSPQQASQQYPQFLCPVCSRSVERLDRFKAHLLDHLEDHTKKRSPYYCLHCAQVFAFPLTLGSHQHSEPKCSGTIEPVFKEFLRTQILRSGQLQPLKWKWGCGKSFGTHSGVYYHLNNSWECKKSLEDVEKWIADYLSVLLSDVTEHESRKAAMDTSESRERAVAQRGELTKWLLEIGDPQKQAIALKVVATKYDVCKMLLDGRSLQEIKDQIAKDISKEQHEIQKAESDAARQRDVVNAIWEMVDRLPLV